VKHVRLVCPGIASIFILLSLAGCRKDEGAVQPPADTLKTGTSYGTGLLSFRAAGAGGQFLASGAFKPSDQFTTDSISQGAGGFIRDTVLFQRSIAGMIAAYNHHLAGGTLNERVLVLTLRGTSRTLTAGDYPFAPSNAAQASQAAYVYFFFSDSVSFHDVYVPRSGLLTLSSFNPSTRHLQGTFSGTLWGPLPDTLTQIQVTDGQFDLSCVSTYFNP
jgi:hypothetical protein